MFYSHCCLNWKGPPLNWSELVTFREIGLGKAGSLKIHPDPHQPTVLASPGFLSPDPAGTWFSWCWVQALEMLGTNTCWWGSRPSRYVSPWGEGHSILQNPRGPKAVLSSWAGPSFWGWKDFLPHEETWRHRARPSCASPAETCQCWSHCACYPRPSNMATEHTKPKPAGKGTGAWQPEGERATRTWSSCPAVEAEL